MSVVSVAPAFGPQRGSFFPEGYHPLAAQNSIYIHGEVKTSIDLSIAKEGTRFMVLFVGAVGSTNLAEQQVTPDVIEAITNATWALTEHGYYGSANISSAKTNDPSAASDEQSNYYYITSNTGLSAEILIVSKWPDGGRALYNLRQSPADVPALDDPAVFNEFMQARSQLQTVYAYITVKVRE
jgi:hypothetical protein